MERRNFRAEPLAETFMRLLNGGVPDCAARLRWGVGDVQAIRSARTARRRRETEPK